MDGDGGVKLAELLCARLCHDLAGPVGAVGTGAELLAEEAEDGGGIGSEALALLVSSAATAGARLRFLRLALGGGNQLMGGRQVRDLAQAYLAGTGDGLGFDWQDSGGETPWTAEQIRLLTNLLMAARDCLPRGGGIQVVARQPGAAVLVLTASGRSAAAGESLKSMAAQGPDSLGPRGAQGYYLSLLARQMGVRVVYSETMEQVTLRVETESKG